ncbi:UbiX family flavin prenyltransferase [bacterium]|nr:MAG: UbiX family flavin prenyltransferase [bacterium]
MDMNKRLTVAVTGASGALYAVRLLRYLMMNTFEVDFIVSDAGKITFKVEMDANLDKEDISAFLKKKFGPSVMKGSIKTYSNDSISAPMASGSVRRLGMVIVPCSMKTMSALAHGAAANLIERSADVALKERFPLVVVPRETPMNSIQIKNMLKLSQAGALIVPAMPAFYQKPQSLDDLADFITGRVLNLLGIEGHGLFNDWGN